MSRALQVKLAQTQNRLFSYGNCGVGCTRAHDTAHFLVTVLLVQEMVLGSLSLVRASFLRFACHSSESGPDSLGSL